MGKRYVYRAPRSPEEIYSDDVAPEMGKWYAGQASRMGVQWAAIRDSQRFAEYVLQHDWTAEQSMSRYLTGHLPRGLYGKYQKKAKYYRACMVRLDHMLGEHEAQMISNYICQAITEMHEDAYTINRHLLGVDHPSVKFKRVRRFRVPRFSPVHPHARRPDGKEWRPYFDVM